MNFTRYTAILAVFSILTAYGQEPIAAIADEPAFNAEAEYGVLEAGEDTGGRAWFELAGKARSAGDLDTASRAPENAVAQKFSPPRVGMETAQKGCVLLEHWTSATGSKGMSINYVDKPTDEWVQIWNSEGGSQINIRGGLTDKGMLLVGNIHYVANGTTAPFRGTWTLLSDGRVRQFFEQSNDDGETWVPWFEGFYTRIDSNDQTSRLSN